MLKIYIGLILSQAIIYILMLFKIKLLVDLVDKVNDDNIKRYIRLSSKLRRLEKQSIKNVNELGTLIADVEKGINQILGDD